MDGAALLALFAAVGFGWQPMPDGSQRYEYIVQVDDELAATLASGKSIPIVSEVPDGIHPIARVRIVVGDGEPPRERLVTRLKPAVDDAMIVRGQNAVANNPYVAAQPLADAGAAASSWNGGTAAAPAPSSQQLFDGASAAAEQAWNNNIAAPASEALNRVGQTVQDQYVQPLQQQAQQQFQQQVEGVRNQVQQNLGNLGQNVQNAAQTGVQNTATALGERTKSLIDQLGRPISQQPVQTARDLRREGQLPQQGQAAPLASVPPPSTGAAASPYAASPYGGTTTSPVNSWNDDPAPATNPLRSDVPGTSASAAGSEWNSQQNVFPGGSPQAQPGIGNNVANGQPLQYGSPIQPPPSSSAQTFPPTYGSSNPASGANQWNADDASNSTTPIVPPGVNNGGSMAAGDPWQGAPDPRTPASNAATGSNGNDPIGPDLAGQNAPFRGGSTWPGEGNGLGGQSNNGNLGISPPHVATPDVMVDRNSLSAPPNRPLEGASSPLAASIGAPAGDASTPNAQNSAMSTPRDIFASTRPGAATGPSAATPTGAAAAPPQPGATASSSPSGADNAVVTLVAWVLLFGSVFGNLYLFWSYLDVRQKYRALVRKTARAVGSRFSAA